MDAPAAEQITTQPTAGPPPAEPAAGGRRARRHVGDYLEEYALVILTIALAILFSLLPATTEAFPTSANFQVMLGEQAVLMLVALAVLLPVATGVWDFTPGATTGLASIYAASVMAGSGSIVVAVLIACAVGVAVGVVNGILVSHLKINSVIATFGMTILIAGVVQAKTGGNSIVGVPASLTDFGSSRLIGLPVVTFVALGVAFVVWYLLVRTPFGRYLYSIGSNRHAATLVGLRVNRLTVIAFAAGGALAGIAGVIYLARAGAGNPVIGPGYTLPAYAAVFLGAVAIRPGTVNVWGTVIAIVFLAVLNNGLSLAGASPYVANFANGFALLAGVALANALARKRGRVIETA
ncbi:MAG: ribose transport system permease protein [Thermoleophilaceae bacterium]|jgi:ribose transport system permease protein|nr:ribose transport system permease protein [Thermoleophilaceae bacterium]